MNTLEISLRPFKMEDDVFIKSLLTSKNVMKFALVNRALTDKEAETFIKDHFASESDAYGLKVLCIQRESIGFAGLLECRYLGSDDLELGFVIDPKQQGKGYAAEIGKILICQALSDKNRVLALVHPDNTNCRKVLSEKLKMTKDQEIITPDRGARQVYIYALK